MKLSLPPSVAAAAAAGLMHAACGGPSTGPTAPQATPSEEPLETEPAKAPRDPVPGVADAGADKECCKGLNECRNQGSCAVEGRHECKGQNDCKGQSGCDAHCPK